MEDIIERFKKENTKEVFVKNIQILILIDVTIESIFEA